MYIYQVERTLLGRQMQWASKYIHGDVLDVGGGERSRYRSYFKYDSYTGLDIAEGPDVSIVASADSIPLPDACKDSILSTQMLEHVKYPEKCVQEMYRVLKSGGHAVITAPQWNELHAEPMDYWRYTKYGFVELFERNGFAVVEYQQRGGYFSVLAQMKQRYLMDRLDLYHRPLLGRLCSMWFSFKGKIAIYLDSRDTSAANRKHAIGWCFVFIKK